MRPGVTSVSLVKGNDRYSNLSAALELIRDDIQLGDDRTILLKPNLTSGTSSLAVTHVDAVRAVLDFLKPLTSARIIIGEGTGTGAASTRAVFKKFGYTELSDRYQVPLIDLNQDEPIYVQVLDGHLRPLKIRISRTAFTADYRISITVPKTHDFVMMTASLKNMVMGSVIRRDNPVMKLLFLLGRLFPKASTMSVQPGLMTSILKLLGNDKATVHQGYPAMHLSLYKLARIVPPHLAVIDGFEAMEGDGPAAGDRVNLGVAVASTDFVACDSVVARLMGFDLKEIGYLTYSWHAGLGEGDLSKVQVLGNRLEECACPFKRHPTQHLQSRWYTTDTERLFRQSLGSEDMQV